MKQKSISQNAILNIIYTLTNMIFPLFTFPYVSRIILVDLMGRISFYQSISSYAIMVASVGISTYGIRAVARCRDDKVLLTKTVQELFIINSIGTAFVICVILFSLLFLDRLKDDALLLIINILLILTAPLGMNWLYSGLEQYSFITRRAIAVKVLSLMAIFAFVKTKDDYTIYALIIALSSVITYVINFAFCQKFISFKLIKHNYKPHFKPMLLLFSSILAINIYTHLDSAMLGFICDDRQVGLYTIAIYAKTALLTTVNAISAVLLPRVSYYFSNENTDALHSLLRKSISIISMISVPLTVFFILKAKDCVLILGGEDYIDSVPCMQVIMPVLLISGFSNITGNQILIPQGKDSCFMKAVVSGAFADIILNSLLMPHYGCLGAATATLIAEMIQMMIQLHFAKGFVIPNVSLKKTFIIFFSTCESALVMCGIERVLVLKNFWIEFIVCAMSFFIIYMISLLVFKEEYLLTYVHSFQRKVFTRR